MIKENSGELLDLFGEIFEWFAALTASAVIGLVVLAVIALIVIGSKTFMDRFERGVGDLLLLVGGIIGMISYIYLDVYLLIPAYDAGDFNIPFWAFIVFQFPLGLVPIGTILRILNPRN